MQGQLEEFLSISGSLPAPPWEHRRMEPPYLFAEDRSLGPCNVLSENYVSVYLLATEYLLYLQKGLRQKGNYEVPIKSLDTKAQLSFPGWQYSV